MPSTAGSTARRSRSTARRAKSSCARTCGRDRRALHGCARHRAERAVQPAALAAPRRPAAVVVQQLLGRPTEQRRVRGRGARTPTGPRCSTSTSSSTPTGDGPTPSKACTCARPTPSTSATRVPTSSPPGRCHLRSRSQSTTSASASTTDRHVGSADRHHHGFFGRARLSEPARFGHRRGFGAGDAHARPDGAARRARRDGGHDGRRGRRGLAAAPGQQRRPRVAAAARHLGHARAHQGMDLRRPLPLSLSPRTSCSTGSASSAAGR